MNFPLYIYFKKIQSGEKEVQGRVYIYFLIYIKKQYTNYYTYLFLFLYIHLIYYLFFL